MQQMLTTTKDELALRQWENGFYDVQVKEV